MIIYDLFPMISNDISSRCLSLDGHFAVLQGTLKPPNDRQRVRMPQWPARRKERQRKNRRNQAAWGRQLEMVI